MLLAAIELPVRDPGTVLQVSSFILLAAQGRDRGPALGLGRRTCSSSRFTGGRRGFWSGSGFFLLGSGTIGAWTGRVAIWTAWRTAGLFGRSRPPPLARGWRCSTTRGSGLRGVHRGALPVHGHSRHWSRAIVLARLADGVAGRRPAGPAEGGVAVAARASAPRPGAGWAVDSRGHDPSPAIFRAAGGGWRWASSRGRTAVTTVSNEPLFRGLACRSLIAW